MLRAFAFALTGLKIQIILYFMALRTILLPGLFQSAFLNFMKNLSKKNLPEVKLPEDLFKFYFNLITFNSMIAQPF
ncbi:hypothetical protein B0A64_03895 [Flavobacterium araucananum]|uniref:Uncharacterized protein n=1 Tax=Flavobacterium araucananum TaxID=946678 RepID=A0A227PGZ0_9FLAO|nr:hypothetical protein B0A64_03895 [Flavobacterium araucananum]